MNAFEESLLAARVAEANRQLAIAHFGAEPLTWRLTFGLGYELRGWFEPIEDEV
jgi:hypothetical protein